MPLKVEFSDKNNKYQYDGHANELPSSGRGKLYIGDRDSGSMVQLRHRKIVKTVNCQTDMFGLSKEESIKALKIDPIDNNFSCVALAYDFILKGVEKGENVLIFDHTGYGRSAAVALYYLMRAGKGMSLADAHRTIENIRPGVQCNNRSAGFRLELMQKLIVEEKKLRKTTTCTVDPATRMINYTDGKGAPGVGFGSNKVAGGSASSKKGSPWTGLIVFGAFIAVLYAALLQATGGK